MIIRVIPYELVENLFGTWVADNFNKINLVLLCLGFLCWALFGRKTTKKTVRKYTPIQPQREFNYIIDEEGHIVPDKSTQYRKPEIQEDDPPIAESYFGQYDRYSDLTDEEMKLAMQIRISRDYPTFEEWKAQQENKTE